MQNYRKHIRGIIDELMNNSLTAKATKLDIKVEHVGNEAVIKVSDNGLGMSQERLTAVRKKLDQPRRHELEEYYGALAGQSMVGTGLSLVGMMSDKAEVKTELGKGTEITIWINIKNK